MIHMTIMVRATIVLLAGMLVGGAAALAATPPVAAEPRDGALGLVGTAAVPTPAAVPPARATAPAQASAERVPSGNPLWAIPLRQLSATRERPLFAPSRRPPPPVVAYQLASVPSSPPPKPAEPEKPRLELVGTIAGQGDGIGVFLNLATRTVLRLKMGEGHEGWVLRGIQRREVTLEKGRQTVVLALPLPEMGKAGAAPPPAVAPQQNRRARGVDNVSPEPPGPAPTSPAPRPVADAAGLPSVSTPLAGFTPPMPVFPQLKPAAASVNPFRDTLPIRR
jgi:hypothetical protein